MQHKLTCQCTYFRLGCVILKTGEKEAGIQVYHSKEGKLFRSLCTHKDSVNEFQKPGVYRIPCECGLVYIGETGRSLSLCLKKHKTNCEKVELEKSAVAKHSWTNDDRIK